VKNVIECSDGTKYNNDSVKKSVKEHGLDWVVAAMVDGSIGYYSVVGAENMLNAVCKDQYACCERTDACFHSDPVAEIMHDVKCFEYLAQSNNGKVPKLIELVRELRKLSWEQQTTFSMMYPTSGI
jgi:hypothetical protein